MGHGIFGWDLPPGCRVSDIPGNRPEDEAWERIYDNFWDKERLTKTHIGMRISDKEYEEMDKLYNGEHSEIIDNYIMAAIEYGMEVERADTEKNAGYEKDSLSAWHEERRNPKLRAYFKKQRESLRELSGVVKQLVRYCEQWQSSNRQSPNGDGRILLLKNATKALSKTKEG